MRAADIEQNKMPHLFLDMDGVQADFFTQWARWWSNKMNDPNIQWYKDIGDKEQREISNKKKIITQASIEGKKYWLSQHNSNMPAIFDGMKERYATKGGQPNVLIDDHKKYINSWESAGGIGVLHRWNNTNDTIKKLNEIYRPYLDK